jgi:hypothetical protein
MKKNLLSIIVIILTIVCIAAITIWTTAPDVGAATPTDITEATPSDMEV